MDFSEVKVNNALAEGGVWMEHDDTTSFLVARMGNKKFQTYFQKLIRPYQRQFDAGKLSAEKQTDIMCKCMAKTVLLDWRGLTMDGEEIEYSEERAYELLSMEGADEFRDLVTSYAQDAEAYRNDTLEEQGKN
jgi:hypothetical protein